MSYFMQSNEHYMSMHAKIQCQNMHAKFQVATCIDIFVRKDLTGLLKVKIYRDFYGS
jgi:hypothetical protein